MRNTFNIIVFLCAIVTMSFGQMDTTISLVSKIDFSPQYQLHDGNQILLMGYTQSIGGTIDLPSPTINVKEGDSVQIDMWNLSQGPPHTIHLHGLDVNQANDGVPMLSFYVEHDDTGSYYMKVPHPGTYLYHCHETSVLHVQSGMYGLLIVRPQSADTLTWEGGYSFHQEKAWLISEVDTNWHADSIINHPHDPTAMTHIILDYAPQHFLINGKSEQQLSHPEFEIDAAVDEVVLLRLANIGYYGNRFIFPSGLNAEIISSDGRPLPASYSSDTLDILPGERYQVLFKATNEFTDSIQVDYFSLSTEEVMGTQFTDVTISGTLGVTDLSLEDALIFPNPAKDEINIRLSEKLKNQATITVRDVSGQLILTEKMPQNQMIYLLSARNFSNGIYFIGIENDHLQLNQKIIVQH